MMQMYDYSLVAALSLLLFFAVYFLVAKPPDKPIFAVYVRSRRIMGLALLVLACNYIVHLFVGVRFLNHTAAILLNISTYFLAYWLFSSAFIILLDRSVRIGDLVEVGAFQGVVTKINTRYSVVRNLSGEELVVPNEMFVTSSVKNFSGSDRAATGSVEVGIAYEANVDRALEILLDIMKSQPRVMQTPAPRVVISGFGDSEIMLKGVFWVRDPEAGVGSLKSAIFREVLRRFDAENIEIPYAKSEVKLSGAVALTPAANVESQPAVKPAEVKAGQAVK